MSNLPQLDINDQKELQRVQEAEGQRAMLQGGDSLSTILSNQMTGLANLISTMQSSTNSQTPASRNASTLEASRPPQSAVAKTHVYETASTDFSTYKSWC